MLFYKVKTFNIKGKQVLQKNNKQKINIKLLYKALHFKYH